MLVVVSIFIPRLGKLDIFKDEVDACKDKLNDCIVQRWRRSKKAGVSLRTFLQNSIGLFGVIMPSDEIQAVLAARGCISGLSGQVVRLARCGALGEELFGSFLGDIEKHKFSRDIVKDVTKFCDAGDFSEAAFATIKATLAGMADKVGKRLSAGTQRNSVVHFLDSEFKMPLGDLHLEWNIALAAHLKSKLVQCDSTFPRLPYEDLYFPKIDAKFDIKVDGVK